MVSKNGLIIFIKEKIGNYKDASFGKCFAHPECTGYLYPEEIKPYFTKSPVAAAAAGAAAAAAAENNAVTPAVAAELSRIYTRYRELFNVKYHALMEENNNAPADAGGAGAGAAAAGAGAGATAAAATAGMRGGMRSVHKSNPGNFFQPLMDGTCFLPPKGVRINKTRKRKANRRASRRLRR